MGRPKRKVELIEGTQAFKNFQDVAKTVFRAARADVEEAERKHKAARKRKKS